MQQVNKTVTEMDKVVQQNAAAVQQSSAAAEGMRQQAEGLVQAVSTFRLTLEDRIGDRPRVARRPPDRMELRPPTQKSVPHAKTQPMLTSNTDGWEEF